MYKAAHIFSANGIFKPNISGASTHQPRGYDQIQALYDHFHVVGAIMTIEAPPSSEAYIMGISLKDASPVETSLTNYLETRLVNSKQMSAGAGDSKQVSKGFSTKGFFTRRDSFADDQLRGSFAGNPAEQAYFHLFYGASQTGIDPNAVSFNVTIKYRVVFTEPKNPAQS